MSSVSIPGRSFSRRRVIGLLFAMTALPLVVLLLFCFTFRYSSVDMAGRARKPLKILVFGGTGFVGSNFISKALDRGHSVVALARRKPLSNPHHQGAKFISCDVADKAELDKCLHNEGDFDASVHAIGLLFDSKSNLGSWNKFASGSGSVPDPNATYDMITRQSACNALDVFKERSSSEGNGTRPFVFISAAEAGWTFTVPVNWLERYLTAKRAVESRLTADSAVRPVIFRPSLIWTPERPLGLLSVIPFFVGNALGIPIVDRPVTVDSLTTAILAAIENDAVSGVQRYPEIDKLSQEFAGGGRRREL